jgi:hypothetical protein
VSEKLAEARGGPAVPEGVSGALELDTLYRFTVQYDVGDDRVANVSTLVHAVDARVPSVTLQAPTQKTASSIALRLVGAAARTPTPTARRPTAPSRFRGPPCPPSTFQTLRTSSPPRTPPAW